MDFYDLIIIKKYVKYYYLRVFTYVKMNNDGLTEFDLLLEKVAYIIVFLMICWTATILVK